MKKLTLDEMIEEIRDDLELDVEINDLRPQLVRYLEELKQYRKIEAERCNSPQTFSTYQEVYNLFHNYRNYQYDKIMPMLRPVERYYKEGDIVATEHGLDIGLVVEDTDKDHLRVYAPWNGLGETFGNCGLQTYGGYKNVWYKTGLRTTRDIWKEISLKQREELNKEDELER